MDRIGGLHHVIAMIGRLVGEWYVRTGRGVARCL